MGDQSIQLLDHGYVRVVRVEGSDAEIAQNARMSTATEGDPEKDARLTARLIRDKHTSPVEFVGFVFEVQCPIFVARQWVRHRAGTFNEFSGRYTEFPDIFYVPDVERCQAQSTFNKQGSAEQLPESDAELIRGLIGYQSADAYSAYQSLIEMGLTRELARIVLPVNYYTKYRWRVSLHNLFHFLKLREDPHAQYEIRVYAEAIHKICQEHFPVATAAFEQHIQDVVTISPALARQLAELVTSEEGASSEMMEFLRRHGT